MKRTKGRGALLVNLRVAAINFGKGEKEMIKGIGIFLALVLILGLGAITLAEQPAGMKGPGMSGQEMMKQPEMMRQMSTMMENMQRMMKDMADMMADMGKMMEECQKIMGGPMKPEKPSK